MRTQSGAENAGFYQRRDRGDRRARAESSAAAPHTFQEREEFVNAAALDCDGPARGRAAPASLRSQRSLRFNSLVRDAVRLIPTHEQLRSYEPGEDRASEQHAMTRVWREQHEHCCDGAV